MFESAEDASRALATCFCEYRGEYYQIERTAAKDVVFIRGLTNGDVKRVHIDNIKVRELTVGYYQDGDKAVYLSRLPRRTTKIGLTWRGLTDDVMFTGQAMADALSGNFPTYAAALERLPNRQSVAFSKNFAVRNHGGFVTTLEFMGDSIAVIKNGRVLFDDIPGISFFVKSLRELNVNV